MTAAEGFDAAASDAVRWLRDVVRARSAAIRAEPGWSPAAHAYVHFDFIRFVYGNQGIGDYELQPSVVQKDTWSGEPLERAVAGIQPAIDAAAASLVHLNADPLKVRRGVAYVCDWLMLDELEGRGTDDDETERRALQLVRSLRGRPLRAWVEADLAGVAPQCPPLEFDGGDGVRVSLRPIGPEDLGGDIFIEWAQAAKQRLHSRPSAILRLEYEAVDTEGWQPHLERAVAILRLFGVGGVDWTRAEMGTESVLDVHGVTLFKDQDGGSRRTYAIDSDSAARLPEFWKRVGAALPKHFYSEQPEDPAGMDLAWLNYRREAGLLGHVDERIAGTVRCLESLLLAGRQRGRITARLAEDTATLLGECGFEPDEVRRTIRRAYDVRSRYVHGDDRGSRTPAQLDRDARRLIPLLYRCLDYVRAALVAAVLAGLDKPGLLRLLADEEALRRAGAAYREVHGG